MEIFEKLIGMRYEEAELLAEQNKYFLRKIAEDDKNFIITLEYDPRRINVSVLNNRIENVKGIG